MSDQKNKKSSNADLSNAEPDPTAQSDSFLSGLPDLKNAHEELKAKGAGDFKKDEDNSVGEKKSDQ